MSSAAEAKVEIETGQTLSDYAVMTDAGDHKIHYIAAATIWSNKSGKTPIVRPNGITSGRNLLTVGGTNDTVRYAGFTAYSKGVEKTVSASTTTITRPTSAGYYKINSITMASDGSIAVVSGDQHASAFSETRAAAGGPPLIPVNSVEIGQIRTTGATAEALTSDEVFQNVGQHTERYDYPLWDEYPIGQGEAAATSPQKKAHINFQSALPLAHTGAVAKKVYLRYYAPQFSEVQRALDFVPVENAHAVSSVQHYRGTIASVTTSIGQGSFTAMLSDGVTDALIANKDDILTVRFYPDENKAPYILTQGKIGLGRTFPVGAQIQAAVTISAESISAEFSS